MAVVEHFLGRVESQLGRELHQMMSDSSPDLAKKVIFITGDVANADTRAFLDSTARPILSKPFTIEAIRQLL